MSNEFKPKGTASGILVYCAFDKIVDIKALKPNPQNPNRHSAEQVQKIASNIRALGWRNPITVSSRSGLIVKGHGRLMAAQFMDWSEVPVDFQQYASEAEETADLIADNRLQELSEIDKKALLQCFENYDTGEIPFELCGYTEDEYGELASMFDEYEPKEKNETKQKEVSFKCCDFKKCCPCYGQPGCSRCENSGRT